MQTGATFTSKSLPRIMSDTSQSRQKFPYFVTPLVLKFIYSEKATKFCKIFTFTFCGLLRIYELYILHTMLKKLSWENGFWEVSKIVCLNSMACVQTIFLNRMMEFQVKFCHHSGLRLTLRFFFKFVSWANNSKSYPPTKGPRERKKCSLWKVFGTNHPQTLQILSRRGPRSPDKKLSQHYNPLK